MRKPWWKSYLSFSKTETNGIVVLTVLMFLLLGVRLTMHLWVKPPSSPEDDAALVAAWQKYKAAHLATASASKGGEDSVMRGELFVFDPNTIDSLQCIRLGLRPVTTRMLLNWRRKGKVFYKKEDLKPLYTLKEEEYERLAPFISITAVRQNKYADYKRQEPLPARLDLNTTDSATLVRLNGIGPVLAQKIVEQRKALGGYLKHEQLNELYRFPDTTYKMLGERLVIEPGLVKKLRLNTANLEELRKHPYIGEKMAKNILLLRDGLGGFKDIKQLRQVPLMNEENYRKIAPYFTLD